MTTKGWTWANLDGEQLELVAQAEQSLGANYILVYRPVTTSSRAVEAHVRQMHAAQLDESQLECLHGLEQRLQAVAVAYIADTA